MVPSCAASAPAARADAAVACADWQLGDSPSARAQWQDPVTGLSRPGIFLARLEHAIGRAASHPFAVLLLEIANFGEIIDEHGQDGAEELLRVIAERLHEEVPAPELLTRLRGAEFAIALPDSGDGASAEALATEILERVSEPCWTGARAASSRAIGAVVLADDPHETAVHVLDRATRALHRARSYRGAA